MWQYRSALPADLPGLSALLELSGGARLWELWKAAGLSPLDHVLAVGAGPVGGALRFASVGDRGAMIGPLWVLPGKGEGPAPADLVRGALPVLRGRFAYVQALVEADDAEAGLALAAAGIPRAATLLSLERPAGPEDAGIHPEVVLTYAKGGDLTALIQRTLQGAADVPSLQEALPASEILASYRPGAADPPPHWYRAEALGEPVGCLLLNPLADGALELKYMGVVPEERGKGLGRTLMRRAIEEAVQGGFPRMTVLVDEANAAAKATYFGHGFRLRERKAFHFIAFA
jgi:ribosomal protein S18 acetylase RimI-like enzyme